MKNEDKGSSPRVRVVVLGNMNVGKSGKFKFINLPLPTSYNIKDALRKKKSIKYISSL